MSLSVLINIVIFIEEPCFGAKELETELKNENGDTVYFTYNGYNYAMLDYCSKYSVNLELNFNAITRYLCGFIDSTVNEYNVYGYNGDDSRMFLWCDYTDMIRPYGGVYYRADLLLPEISEETVDSISFYKLNESDKEILFYSESDEATIEKWLERYNKNNLKDLESYYDNGNKRNDVYCVYAVFDDLNLKYELAYLKLDEEDIKTRLE